MIRVLAAIACATIAAGACAADPQYKHADAGTGSSGGSLGSGGASAGGTGGGTGAGTGGAAPLADTTTQSYDADDPNIQYTGRITFTNPKQPRFDLGATTITARFTGTAVAVSLKDEFRYGKYVNSYQAIIDGQPVMIVVPKANVTKYVIANALAAGDHQITLVKRTEAAAGSGFFLGFSFAGAILPPPARPTRRIEFIGDSITAGAGIDAANGAMACNAQPDGWGLPVENAYKAYGPVIARALAAEVHVVGVSGIGLVRNYSNMYDARTMPQVYDLYAPQLMDTAAFMQPRWDATQRMTWVPDAIVIGLGTNDFGQGDPSDTTQVYPHPAMTAQMFAAGHIAFATTLRGYYPNAHIFLLSSPAVDNAALGSALTMAEAHFTAAGDTKVHQFVIPRIAGRGCGTHPDADQHAEIARLLTPIIAQALGW